jgi:DNA-binding MarR family transcriptional regulator
MQIKYLLKITHGAMKEPSLTIEQACILGHLYSSSAAMDFGDLAKIVGVPDSNMTRQLNYLGSNKLIQKARSAADDRKVLVTITETGCKRLHDMGIV